MIGQLKVAFNRQIANENSDMVLVFFKEEYFDTETQMRSVRIQKFAIGKTQNLDDQFDHLSETWDLVTLPSEDDPLPTLKKK
jgi:hypothetical protein